MMNRYLLGALLAGPVLTARAQTFDPTFTPPVSLYAPGTVSALGPAQADGKRVLFGNFQRVGGLAARSLVRLDAAGNLDQAFGQNVGTPSAVYRVRAGLNGQYLLGYAGAVQAGGLTRNEVLRLNADGTADASFDPGAGPRLGTDSGYGLDYAVQPDGKVLVGGAFDTYSGVAARGLVRLTATGSVDATFSVGQGLTFGPGYDNDVQALLVLPNGQLLAGGSFDTFDGVSTPGLVRLNATGSVDAAFQSSLPAGAVVMALVPQPDGKVLVTGRLGSDAGGAVTLVRLLASGARDPGFTMPTSLGVVNGYDTPVAVLPGGQLVVIGSFGSRQVLRLNSDGSEDAAFALSAPPTSTQLAVGTQPGGALLLVSGAANNRYGTREGTVAAYSRAGTLVAGYHPNPLTAGSVQATARLSSGDLVVAGNFTEWNGQPTHHLARLSSTGTFDAAFAAASGPLPGPATQLAVQLDDKLLVGTGQGLVRVAATGASDNTFAAFMGAAPIAALAVQPDGRILVGGNFQPFATYKALVRLTASGAHDPTFDRATTPGTTGPRAVGAMLVQPDGRIVVAGRFANFTEENAYVVRYEANGDDDSSFRPTYLRGSTAYSVPLVYSLVQQPDGRLLVGGNFASLGPNGATVNSPRVARVLTTGYADPSFVAPSSLTGTTFALAVQPNGRVLVGGSLAFSGGSRLLRLLGNGQLDASFATQNSPNALVASLLVQPDGGIVVGGAFSTLAGQLALRLARLNAPNVLAVAAPAAVAAATTAWPVPAHEVLRVQPAPATHPQAAELLDALGRVVRQQALAGPGEFSLDTSALPAGLYVLRVRYAEGAVSRQVAVE